ncbi:MAG: hypothetical protein KTR14_10370 [Vampirovibrio sp.]|nr:hypothetical protein [Vampirovibrio sp.]
MLTLTVQNTDNQAVGAEHGLDLQKEYEAYGPSLEKIVQDIYTCKDQDGGWKKWLNLPYDEALVNEIEKYAASVKGKYTDLVILGIGGSSLGGFALLKALLHPYWNDLPVEKRRGYPRFYFVDNVDTDQINGLLDILDLNTTLVNVITKSGTTAETMSAFMLLKDRLDKALGAETAKKHIVATTDPKKGILRDLATQEGYPTFEVPDDVGGRFSIFCAVGLLPAALCGVDIRQMQQGIRDLDAQLKQPDLNQNPAAQNALVQYLLYGRGKTISVFMPYSARLAPVSDWYVQLWAESLGKKLDLDGRVVHVGPTPVRSVGVTDQHSQVQLFNEGPNNKVITFVQVQAPDGNLSIPSPFKIEDLSYLENKTFHQLMTAEFESTRASLTNNQRPNVTITLPKLDAYHFAQLLYLLEVQTAIAGALFHIDPFDQPGVELAKKYTYALMGRKGFEHMVDEAKGKKTTSAS